MWERSFVAMTVLVGGSLDEALDGLAPSAAAAPPVADLAARLRAPSRGARAAALAEIGREIALTIDEVKLA